MNVDFLVIRVSRSGKLGSSRPCQKCLQYMTAAQRKNNLRIRHVYFSEQDGSITKMKFSQLLAEPQYVSTGFRHKSPKKILRKDEPNLCAGA